MATEILAFIPGILGSELWDGDDRIWPGSLWEAIRGFDEEKFQRLLKPGLVPRDILREAAGGLVGVYRPWIKAFESIRRGGTQPFVENPAGGAAKTLHPFPYDWRQDLRQTADRLADFLDDIVATQADADLKLVCHSMGGLLARYYLESGRFTARSAFGRVSVLLTFGTPHNGAPKAYASAIGLHKAEFLSVEQTRRMANDGRYPSLFQLFPARGHSFIWAADPAAAIKDYASDDAALVQHYRLDSSNLSAWHEFRQALSDTPAGSIRYFYIVGSTQDTLVRFRWTGTELQPIELDDAGDGTVPLSGAMQSSIQTDFVGKSHVSLIETRPARETLAALFGGTTVLSAKDFGQVTLTVRDIVVGSDSPVHVQITFEPEVDRFKGALRFQRADVPTEANADVGTTGTVSFHDVVDRNEIPVDFTSAGISYLNLKSDALEYPGIYRPVLRHEGGPDVVGPEFVVQRA
jgi:phospholipase A1